MDKLKRIYDTFVSSGRFISATPYGSGHINDTYLVKVDEDVEYILQRINGNVFKDIPKLVRNKELVCGHIRNRLIRHKVSDITRKYITYFYTVKGNAYYKDYEETTGRYHSLSKAQRATMLSRIPRSLIKWVSGSENSRTGFPISMRNC